MATSNDNQHVCFELAKVDSTESDDEDDAFTFQKRSFERRSHTIIESPSRKRRKKRKPNSRDENWAAISRKSRERLQRVAKKAAALSDSDSDDLDVDNTASTKKVPAPPSAPIPINLLDDSSDDDGTLKIPPSQASVYSFEKNGVSKEVCLTLLKARTAKLELELAQKYHAEDIDVPTDDLLQHGLHFSSLYRQDVAGMSCIPVYQSFAPSLLPEGRSIQEPMTPSQPPVVRTAPTTEHRNDLGPSLSVTMRSLNFNDGKKSSPTCDKLMIRKNEPFEALLSRFLFAKKLDPSLTQIVMKFDGQTISMAKTPASYEMEDEDMVDCEIRVKPSDATVPASQSNSTPAKGEGSACRLKFVTSTKIGRRQQQPTVDIFTVRQRNTVQVLVDQYRTAHKLAAKASVALKFDGELMNTSRMIESYGLEDDDQIDVIVK